MQRGSEQVRGGEVLEIALVCVHPTIFTTFGMKVATMEVTSAPCFVSSNLQLFEYDGCAK
jgi:hypothetical protein